MNKTFFKSALAAAALIFGSAAMAQTATTLAPNDPVVEPGGTVVFDHQVSDAFAAGDTVIIRLPEGVNFVGSVTATGTGGGVQLETNTLGDPADDGLVAYSDLNGDGLNDRAEVTIAAAGTGTVTWEGSIVWSAETTATDANASLQAFHSVALSGGGFQAGLTNAVVNLATKVDEGPNPVVNLATTADITLPNTGDGGTTTGNDVAFPGGAATIVVEVPAGVTTGKTIVLTLGSDLEDAAISGVSSHTFGAPVPTIATVADSDTITLTTTGTTTEASQYSFTINNLDVTEQGSAVLAVATVSGTAGLTGSVDIANLSARGSTIQLATGQDPVTLVRGATAAQILPTFEITEVFADDFDASFGTEITLIAPTGMTFTGAGAVGGTGASGIALSSGSELVITLLDTAAQDTISVSGITATASSSLAAAAAIQAGKSSNAAESDNAPYASVQVAEGADSGAVNIEVDTLLSDTKVGAGATGKTAVIELSEETYGAITTGASTFPFIQFTPSSNVTITGIATNAPVGSLTVGTVGAAVPADGTYLVEITGESSTAIPDTAPFIVTLTYSVDADAAPGSAVVFSIGGNAGVSGSADVADVVETTTTDVAGVIPDQTLTADFVATGTLEVEENFADATTAGSFRLLAPTGVTFASTQNAAVAPVASVSVDTTFTANDTLVITVAPTAAVDTFSLTPNVFISGAAAAGLQTFSVLDGDMQDLNAAEVTPASVDLIYNGVVASVAAGGDIALGEGFTASQTVSGGLQPLTASSSQQAVATVAIEGSVFTVTGVSAGTTQVTITDDLGNTDSVAVTVVAAASSPARTTLDSNGNSTTAVVSGGITTDAGASFDADGVVNVGDTISIIANIQPESAHVGESADILVAVRDNDTGDVYLISGGALILWDGTVNAFDTIALAASNDIDILGGPFTLSSFEAGLDLDIFVGYMLNGVVYYNAEAIDLIISE